MAAVRTPRPLPLVDERFDVPRNKLGPPREVQLEAGDLLYIPRGFVHEAFTSEQASLHLTVGVNVYRWADLLGEALPALTREDQRFREAIPREVLGPAGPASAVRERFTELVKALAAVADVEKAVGKLGDQFFGQLLPLPGQGFAPPDGGEDVKIDTVLEKMPGMICRVVSQGGWVSLEYPGGQVGGPLKIASAPPLRGRGRPIPGPRPARRSEQRRQARAGATAGQRAALSGRRQRRRAGRSLDRCTPRLP